VRRSGDVAQDAQEFRYVFGADGRGEPERLLGFQVVLFSFLLGVLRDKHQGGILRAPKCARLRAQDGNGGCEINCVQVQAHIARSQIWIKCRFDTKLSGQLFVDCFCVAAQIQVALSALRLELWEPGDSRAQVRRRFVLHLFQLCEAFLDVGVSRVEHQSSRQFLRRLLHTPFHCIAFRGLDMITHQLGAQRGHALNKSGIRRRGTCSFFVEDESFVQAARRFGLLAQFDGLLCPLGIGAKAAGWRGRSRGRLRHSLGAEQQHGHEQRGGVSEGAH